MGLRILIFEREPSLRELLNVVLTGAGYQVQTFADPSACPLFHRRDDEEACCASKVPCADALLSDLDLPHISALDFLKLQRLRGCKALDANKAIMGASLTVELQREIAEFGGAYIKKPFHLAEILAWAEGCAQRLAAQES
ncbi:hypothetical protein JCM30471_30660 [Desulfuromonas carbonis]|uniref:response regulator n=1 Tax=Desulfuromonas sp. DDH964 TaxID=1823759 RepID=UPI00078B68C5|nr:response regulator [Desulfuromonas sp. DDH964]AMV71227.1 sigma-54-dependent transcriptional response regulator [Desulfuromonas sp. DDH964]